MQKLAILAAVIGLTAISPAAFADNADCPNGGTVRMGVEPFEAAPKLIPIYAKIGDLISAKLGCKVQVLITTNYTAEIEAMRNGKLEFGEFGPLGYVLAHQVAGAEAVAAFAAKDNKSPDTYTASVVTWPGSGIKTLKEVAGHTFAYSDPASTSGHLFPAYALKEAGIDPDKGITPLYAGSHTASFEAIRNHKVQAGEMNSSQISSATLAGSYEPSDYVQLWVSKSIPNDPIAISSKLTPEFKARLTEVLQNLDLNQLPENDRKEIASTGSRLVPQQDSSFDQIRALVKVLNIDLSKIDS